VCAHSPCLDYYGQGEPKTYMVPWTPSWARSLSGYINSRNVEFGLGDLDFANGYNIYNV
jgi:hypothetical protein